MTKSDTPRALVPGALWTVAGAGWLVGEAVSASAFPGYSYATNYISDLGVPDVGTFQGRSIDSPLHVLMNTTFIGQGVLFGIAAVLAAVVFRAASRRARVATAVLAVVHLVGMVLVGSFHGSQTSTDGGTIVFHVLGAAAAITTGNLVAITAGIGSGALRAPAVYRIASVVLGIVGIVSLVMLVVDSSSTVIEVLPDGVWERASVYTIVAWELLTGIALLVAGSRRLRTARASAVGA